MREIKFRIWDKKNKCWYGADEFRIDGDGDILFTDYDRPAHWGYWGEEYILMQYTGLKDKNGKEIYEGDIVEYSGVNGGIPGGQIGGKDIINYDEEEACFKFGNFSFVNDANQFNDNFPDYDDIEVIGNIYESPGLLKE